MKRLLFFVAVISLAVFASIVLSANSAQIDLDYEIDKEYLYDGESRDEDEYYDEYDDISGYESSFNLGENLLIALAVGLVIALIITGIMRSQMKSVRFERAARNYIRLNSMKITRSHDMYLYSHISKRPKPQNNNKR